MNTKDIQQTDSTRLAELIGLDESAKHLWQPEDLASIFRHQLNAPLDFDLSEVTSDARETLMSSRTNTMNPPKTFFDLFHHPHPPIGLLMLAKELGKANAREPGGVLPREIGTFLYYLSISVALTRRGERITKFSDDKLRKGFDWCIAQPWMDDATRSLFRKGLKQLRTSNAGKR